MKPRNMTDTCPVCGDPSYHEVTEEFSTSSYMTVRFNQVHSSCDECGFQGVNGLQMDHNKAQESLELHGPYKPIVIDGLINAGAYFNWGWKGVGFGQLSFDYDRATGKLTCMNECMSRNSVRKLLHAFADYVADNAELEDER